LYKKPYRKERRGPSLFSLLGVLLVVAVLIAAVVLFAPRNPPSNLVECTLIQVAVFSAQTVSGDRLVNGSATETTATTFTTTTSVTSPQGSVVTTFKTYGNIAAIAPGISKAGNYTACTYLAPSTSSSG